MPCTDRSLIECPSFKHIATWSTLHSNLCFTGNAVYSHNLVEFIIHTHTHHDLWDREIPKTVMMFHASHRHAQSSSDVPTTGFPQTPSSYISSASLHHLYVQYVQTTIVYSSSQQFPNLCNYPTLYFLVFFQIKSTHTSQHIQLIQLCFTLNLHWPSSHYCKSNNLPLTSSTEIQASETVIILSLIHIWRCRRRG